MRAERKKKLEEKLTKAKTMLIRDEKRIKKINKSQDCFIAMLHTVSTDKLLAFTHATGLSCLAVIKLSRFSGFEDGCIIRLLYTVINYTMRVGIVLYGHMSLMKSFH
jgi:hypothetical protein